MFLLEGRTCEQCAWADDSDRAPGQSCLRLKCSNPDVLRQAGEKRPVATIYARSMYCPPDSVGGPHWKAKSAIRHKKATNG